MGIVANASRITSLGFRSSWGEKAAGLCKSTPFKEPPMTLIRNIARKAAFLPRIYSIRLLTKGSFILRGRGTAFFGHHLNAMASGRHALLVRVKTSHTGRSTTPRSAHDDLQDPYTLHPFKGT